MSAEFNVAASRGKEDAWSSIVSAARSANFVAFAERGVAVLERPAGDSTLQQAGVWDQVIAEARDAEILKFCAEGIAVLVW